jgi:hypothetical protein
VGWAHELPLFITTENHDRESVRSNESVNFLLTSEKLPPEVFRRSPENTPFFWIIPEKCSFTGFFDAPKIRTFPITQFPEFFMKIFCLP